MEKYGTKNRSNFEILHEKKKERECDGKKKLK